MTDLLSFLQNKVDLDINNMNQRMKSKYFYIPEQIIQNWIFSIILDSEKCTRYAHMKNQKTLMSI